MSVNRRAFFGAALGSLACARGTAQGLHFAICNETFGKLPFAEACRVTKRAGYQGIELAPFTLAEDPFKLGTGALRKYRLTMADEGVRFAGLHALLNAPAGLHVTTPDDKVRARSWDLIRRLVDDCAELGGGTMVLGSGKQRAVLPGDTRAAAVGRFRDGLAALAPNAASRKVTILVEPLAPHLCNLINTMEEALEIVNQVGNEGVRTMFDTHNAVAEKLPQDEVLRRYLPWIRHVHLNELDGRRPGTGSYRFAPILKVLSENHFPYWVSVEVFNFAEGGEAIATRTMQFLKQEMNNKS